ncbi:hypothetical protein L839_0005 [Mycobacterium avium MAV_120809_2495]|nr:hypothetical protein L839_0005 [Mycobacterium avium MAV_120809_2495]
MHRVRFGGRRPAALAAVFHNSVTFAFAEIMAAATAGRAGAGAARGEQLPLPGRSARTPIWSAMSTCC